MRSFANANARDLAQAVALSGRAHVENRSVSFATSTNPASGT